MILELLFREPVSAIIFLLAIVLAVSIHEAAHAWTADKLGDSTARLLGRTSVNPLAHLDPLGSLLFLIAGFGWGKPVPVNEQRLRHDRDIILVALAGPASNLLIAIILGIAYRLLPVTPFHDVLAIFIFLNLNLMIFNLIPIPPLDGSKILRLFIPAETYQFIEQYGFILILSLFVILRFGSIGFGSMLLGASQTLFTLITGSAVTF